MSNKLTHIYFFLSPNRFHAIQPDGSTNNLIYHADYLKKQGLEVTFVTYDGNNTFWGRTDSKEYKFITFDEFLRNPKGVNSLYISSWDEPVYDLHNYGYDKSKIVLYAQSYISNYAFNFAGHSITISPYCKERLEQQGYKVNYVCMNGIDRELIDKSVFGDVLDLPQKLFPSICTMTPTRDYGILHTMQFMLQEKGYKLDILERKSQIAFWKELAEYDFFLHFYIDDGFGLPPLEAMSLGVVPVILFGDNGTSTYADEYNSLGRYDYKKSDLDMFVNKEQIILNACNNAISHLDNYIKNDFNFSEELFITADGFNINNRTIKQFYNILLDIWGKIG